jgi:hypothetical protein
MADRKAVAKKAARTRKLRAAGKKSHADATTERGWKEGSSHQKAEGCG